MLAAAFAFFAFSITSVGWALVPIGLLLLLAGWSISLFVIGLVLRFGQSAENALAWTMFLSRHTEIRGTFARARN